MATIERAVVACLFVALAPLVHAADAAAKYQAPRNEYGQPDLRGVWNFSSDVPLQRPKDTPDKQFQTREDIAKSNAARQKQIEQLTQQGVGFHNDFWLDYKSQAENLRTSLLLYPPNGRLPKLVDGVTIVGGLAAAFKDIPGTRPVRFGLRYLSAFSMRLERICSTAIRSLCSGGMGSTTTSAPAASARW